MADLEQEDVGEEVILLDVRNEYETKIGNFQIRDDLGNVISAATDPRTRQVRALDLPFSSSGNATSNIVSNFCLMSLLKSFQILLNLLTLMLVITWERRFLCIAQVINKVSY